MSELSAEKLAELREIAGKATPGPWCWYTDGNLMDGATGFAVHSKSDTEDSRVGFDLAVMEYDQMGQLDASHIAAFDPPTVLAMLDRIEELEGQLDAADRQIEARSGKTAGERLFQERCKELEAELAEYREREAGNTVERSVRVLEDMSRQEIQRTVGPWMEVDGDE